MDDGKPKSLYAGLRRPQILQIPAAPEEWEQLKEQSLYSLGAPQSLRESSYRSSLDQASKGSMRERSLGSQQDWPSTVRGSCTYREWTPCSKIARGPIIPKFLPSTARGGGAHREYSSQSFVSTSRRDVPAHAESPRRDRDTYSPPQYSQRLGVYHTPMNERGKPHALGRPLTSVVKTPDLDQISIPRWPPPPTSTLWRSHHRPGMGATRKLDGEASNLTGNWTSMLEKKFTPRGFPAPGGAPLQYTSQQIEHPLVLLAKKSFTKSRAPLKQRPLRPFTHASHERSNQIFEDGLYHMSDKRNIPLAESLFREVLKIDPNHVGALSYLGIIEQEYHQKYIEAEECFIRALAMEPNNSVALGGYALWQQNCGCNADEAERLFTRAVACDPFDAYNQANFGIFLSTVRKDEMRSRQHMLEAFKLEPERPWFRNNAWKF